MAVTINNSYTPAKEESEGVNFSYIIPVENEPKRQSFAPDAFSLMGFGGYDKLRFSDSNMTYDLDECEYTDTSLNVHRIFTEYDAESGRYILKHTVNGGTAVTYASSNYPIKFGFYITNGKVTWYTGVPTCWHAQVTIKIMAVADNGTTYFEKKDGGTVIVGSRQTIQIPNRSYSVTEIVT